MKVPRQQLVKIIASWTNGSKGLSLSHVDSLAAYLLTEGRTGELESILRGLRAAWAEAGYVAVTADSAHELSPSALREIEAEARRLYPAAKHVAITRRVDPTLIGGLRLGIVDYYTDRSVVGALQQLRSLLA